MAGCHHTHGPCMFAGNICRVIYTSSVNNGEGEAGMVQSADSLTGSVIDLYNDVNVNGPCDLEYQSFRNDILLLLC